MVKRQSDGNPVHIFHATIDRIQFLNYVIHAMNIKRSALLLSQMSYNIIIFTLVCHFFRNQDIRSKDFCRAVWYNDTVFLLRPGWGSDATLVASRYQWYCKGYMKWHYNSQVKGTVRPSWAFVTVFLVQEKYKMLSFSIKCVTNPIQIYLF